MKKLKIIGIASMMLMFVSFASAQDCVKWENTIGKRWNQGTIVSHNGSCYRVVQPFFIYWGDPSWIPGGPGLLAMWRQVDCPDDCGESNDCKYGAKPWVDKRGTYWPRYTMICHEGAYYWVRQSFTYWGDPAWTPGAPRTWALYWGPYRF